MTEQEEKLIKFSFVAKCTKELADEMLDYLEKMYGPMSMPSWEEVEEEELEDGS